MKRFIFLFLSAAFFGSGCSTTQIPVVNPPERKPVPSQASSTREITILVSTENTPRYCNGADMDSEGYRKTITEQTMVTVSSTQSQVELVKSIAVLSTTGQCQEAFKEMDFTVTGDTVHIPPINGWAGVSIAMCRCKPEVEVNLLRLPGITKVVWDIQ